VIYPVATVLWWWVAVDRDVEGFGERVLDDPPRLSRGTWGGWTREWRFLIWTWTIDSDSHDWLVETVQRRFLGEEVTRRYSRTLWMLMAWGCVALVAILSVAYVVMAYLMWGASGADRAIVTAFGLAFLPVIVIAAVVAYFTFVPPKEYR
jgi:hypothetical protein